MKTSMRPLSRLLSLEAGSAVLAVASLLVLGVRPPACRAGEAPGPGPVGFLERTNYHGWENALLVSNGRVEAIIVPQIGRVMQFRMSGEADGPFWENPELLGKLPEPGSTNWANFGGDKVWPAPQTEWKDHTKREGPPPEGFDGLPYEVELDGFVVTLTSAVDPHYGIRVKREIQLALDAPVMTVTTTFEKVQGSSLRVSVWAVTQTKSPVAIYSSIPDPSRFREGFHLLSDERPPNLRLGPNWLALPRDPKKPYKIGTDGGALVWIGERSLLRIDSPRHPMAEYPDQGASVEIYTQPDPLAYVELETLGPALKMKSGERIRRTSTYTLLPRTEVDPDLEARKLFLR